MNEPRENQRTAGAQRALGLAELVNKIFTAQRVRSTAEGHAGYRVEMSAPDAPSTADTKRAIQYMKLVPIDPASAASPEGSTTIVMGTADPTLSHTELRSFDHLAALHARRFHGAALPLHRKEYEALLLKAEHFFRGQGIEVKTTTEPSTVPPSSGVAAPRRFPVITAAIVMALAIAIFFAVRLLFAH